VLTGKTRKNRTSDEIRREQIRRLPDAEGASSEKEEIDHGKDYWN
jgi:hypothetical protein